MAGGLAGAAVLVVLVAFSASGLLLAHAENPATARAAMLAAASVLGPTVAIVLAPKCRVAGGRCRQRPVGQWLIGATAVTDGSIHAGPLLGGLSHGGGAPAAPGFPRRALVRAARAHPDPAYGADALAFAALADDGSYTSMSSRPMD